MNVNLDTLIARIALSLWTSERRVERLPVVTEVQPWERAEIVPIPEYIVERWGWYDHGSRISQEWI